MTTTTTKIIQFPRRYMAKKKRSENKKWIKHKTSWGHIRSFFNKTKRKKKEERIREKRKESFTS